MKLGRVCGTVVATVQNEQYQGRKQLIVRYTLPDGSFDGEKYVVAIDQVDAGMGQLVLVEDEGNSARQMTGTEPYGAIRAVVLGIVDEVQLTAPEPEG